MASETCECCGQLVEVLEPPPSTARDHSLMLWALFKHNGRHRDIRAQVLKSPAWRETVRKAQERV